MSDFNNLIESDETVKNNFEYDERVRKIREEISNKFNDYRKTLAFMTADAPISILCLPDVIKNALLAHGLLRIYDLFDCDFTKVKGLGERRIRYLTSCLDEFFSML
jgi:hypothetical protein